MKGFADIHAHPVSHLAFGGRLIWGTPTGSYEEAFPACDGSDHGADSRFFGFNIAQQVLNGVIQNERESSWMYMTWPGLVDHPRDGYPTFRGWPFAGTMCHQQMHLVWLRRAYDHGLRLFSALATNNRGLAWLMGNGSECWDDETIRAQVEELRRLAQHPFSAPWMEIAYSAADAERIIGSDKLAVVLGAEVDQIELFLSHDPKQLAALEEEAAQYLNGTAPSASNIESLAQTIHDVGLRQINPLHFGNNSFGGAALYFDRHASNIRWLNLWRSQRLSGADWPAVESSQEDLEFRFQQYQLAINRGWSILSWPISPVGVNQYAKDDSNHINCQGMTKAGMVFLLNLWKRGIIVDIDHMSMKTKETALTLAERFGIPVISGHCWVRHITLSRSKIGMPDNWWRKWDGKKATDQPSWPMLRHEGMRTQSDIQRINDLGGITATLLRQPAVHKPASLSNVTVSDVETMGTTTAAAAAYLAVVRQLGTGASIGIGSDVNGLAQLPAPSQCCALETFDIYGPNGIERSQTGDRVWDINADGVAHYGMVPDLFYRWRVEGMSADEQAPLFRSAQGYADTWARVEDAATRIRQMAQSDVLKALSIAAARADL